LKQNFNLRNDSKIEEKPGINQSNLVFAYHIPTTEDNKSYAARVLNEIMTGGMSSRLFSEIREKEI